MYAPRKLAEHRRDVFNGFHGLIRSSANYESFRYTYIYFCYICTAHLHDRTNIASEVLLVTSH